MQNLLFYLIMNNLVFNQLFFLKILLLFFFSDFSFRPMSRSVVGTREPITGELISVSSLSGGALQIFRKLFFLLLFRRYVLITLEKK